MITNHKINKLIILFITAITICYTSLMLGFTYYSITDVIDTLIYKQDINGSYFAIFDIRIPRMLMGVLCGSMFALSSSLLQSVFRNPMASSETLGINSASALFVLIGISLFGKSSEYSLLCYSLIGAALGFTITLFSSLDQGKILRVRLIIVGIAIGAFFKSASQFIMTFQDEKLSSFVSFLNGTLYSSTIESASAIIIPSIIVVSITFCCIKQIDLLQLSDDVAISIGFNVTRWKIIIIFLALLLTAIAVSCVGSLGFIGLISPNIARLIFGYSNKYTLLASSLIGIILTISADIIGRIIFIPYEIAPGIISIIIGVPYFLYIMRKLRY
ncbi:MAG: iron ABC transporter permease [Burkholderiales bacterium]|nr:iron ABC transporter permease [Burkholderiales bacterium]